MLSSALLAAVQAGAVWVAGPPLSEPVANNAVAGVMTAEGPAVLSFLGLDRTRVQSGVGTRSILWMPPDSEWIELPAVPGPPLYRAAAGCVGPWIVFAGGTDNPYNYSGVGYDGVPSEPRSQAFAYNVQSGVWRQLESLPHPTMDHRGIVFIDGRGIVVGGMGNDQEVLSTVAYVEIEALLASGR